MRARTRDRRVYLAGHPVLFAVMAATRRWPAIRLGGTVVVHGRDAYVAALTRVPLDRTADGTTGGAADRLGGADAFFDQQGDAHRRTRRSTAEALGADGVNRLRPVWTEILERRLAPLAAGAELDLVPLASEIAGSTAAALLELPVDGVELADAARAAGATAVREHLPGLYRGRARRAATAAARRLTALVATKEGKQAGRAAMLAVAAINTSVAALPRAVAWCADDNLWSYARSHPRSLAGELLRVTAPAPLLPRVAAAEGNLPTSCPSHGDGRAALGSAAPAGLPGRAAPPTGRPGRTIPQGTPPADSPDHDTSRDGTDFRIRAGDRLLLVARHAVGAHRDDPDPAEPAAAQVAQLVFGIGPHACPGARLARAQLVDLLVALAPYQPVVVRARVDRRAALPGWSSLVVRAAAPTASAPAFNPPAQTTTPSNPPAQTTTPTNPPAQTTTPSNPPAQATTPFDAAAQATTPFHAAARTSDAGA